MAPEANFSLISVSSDEDDDVVIQAGVPGGVAPGMVGEVVSSSGAEGEVLSEGDASANDAEELAVHASATPSARSANAMLTTEEDLNAPMPFAGMQRVIMVVFLLLIVAALVYWFFIRPLGA